MTGLEIKELRHKLNMTQQELADEISVARITVIRWESNHKRPSSMAKRQLARLQEKANKEIEVLGGKG